MRVLFCNKYNFRFSGTEQYIFDLSKRLRDSGHETALFSMADKRGAPTPFDEHFLPHIDFKNVAGIRNRAHLAAMRSIHDRPASVSARSSKHFALTLHTCATSTIIFRLRSCGN